MAKARRSEFKVAFIRVAWRLGSLVGICVVLWGVAQMPWMSSVTEAIRGHGDEDDHWIERIGSPAVVYDPRAYAILECDMPPCDRLDEDSLDYNVRIEVLDSGLIEGRGLAYDGNRGRLIVADMWEGLYGYWPDVPKQRPDRLPGIRVCPGGHCQEVDHRGLAFDPDTEQIVVTDFHQHRLALRRPTGEFVGSIGGTRLIDGVTDVALAERGAFFVSATGTEPETAAEPPSRTGVVYHVTDTDARPIVTNLVRPIGVAFSSCQQRLYVADSTPDALTVYFYTQDAQSRWQPAGALATLSTGGNAPPAPLSGIAISACRPADPSTGAGSAGGELFVAGPGGLYLIHPDGTLLAKFVLNERVTALAWDEWIAARHAPDDKEIHQLYMTVGHRIARLHTISGPEPLPTRRPRPTSGDAQP